MKSINLKKNPFVFQFKSLKDKQKVLDNQSWHFDKILLVLKEVMGDEQPSTIDLSHMPFWVRAYDLPLNCRNKETTALIGSKVGVFLTKDRENTRWERIINLNLPLRREINISSKNNIKQWVPLKYEHFLLSTTIVDVVATP